MESMGLTMCRGPDWHVSIARGIALAIFLVWLVRLRLIRPTMRQGRARTARRDQRASISMARDVCRDNRMTMSALTGT